MLDIGPLPSFHLFVQSLILVLTFPLLEVQLRLLQDYFRARMGQPISMYVHGNTYKSRFGKRCETLRVYVFPASSPPVDELLVWYNEKTAYGYQDRRKLTLCFLGLEWKPMLLPIRH